MSSYTMLRAARAFTGLLHHGIGVTQLRWASSLAPEKLHIAYGSQSGTAMTFAAIMTKEAKAQGLKARLSDLEMVQLSELDPEETLLLVMATYGEGEPTDNAADFYEELHGEGAALPDDLHYAVFGLGNSATYPDRFNVVSKAVDKRMAELKAKPVLPLRLGDSASTTARCVDDEFDDWKEDVWAAIREAKASSGGTEENPEDPPLEESAPQSTLGLQLRHYTSDEQAAWQESHPFTPGSDSSVTYKQPARLRAIVNKELHTTASPRSCKHIEFELSSAVFDSDPTQEAAVRYITGDHLGVMPKNRPESVEFFLDNMGYDSDLIVSVDEGCEPQHATLIPPQRVHDILSRRRDLSAPVPRSSLLALSPFATSAAESRTLRGLGAPGHNPHYQDVIVDSHTGMGELTSLFPSLMGNVPLNVMLELLPPMQNRFYSISSSSTEQPDSVSLTVTVVRNQLSSGRIVRGLCSTYLGTLLEQEAVTAFVRQSTLRLPSDPAKPVIMIGAGAGIAPLRAFTRERLLLAEQGHQVGPGLLFFGCEHPSWDFLYQSEFEQAVERGALSGLHPAFAKKPNENGSIYVQHLMSERGKEVLDLVNQGAPVFVCGKGSTVGVGVRDALQEIFQRFAGSSHDESYQQVARMIETQQLQQDVFA